MLISCPNCEPYSSGKLGYKDLEEDTLFTEANTGIEVKIPKGTKVRFCTDCYHASMVLDAKFEQPMWIKQLKLSLFNS